MKKKILIVGLTILVMLVFHQLYWYSAFGGNFTIWINNQSEIELIEDIEVYLDDERIIITDLKSGQLEYKSYTFRINPGKHFLKVVNKNTGVNEECVFYSFLVKRGIISFFPNNETDKVLKTVIYTENIITRKVIN